METAQALAKGQGAKIKKIVRLYIGAMKPLSVINPPLRPVCLAAVIYGNLAFTRCEMDEQTGSVSETKRPPPDRKEVKSDLALLSTSGLWSMPLSGLKLTIPIMPTPYTPGSDISAKSVAQQKLLSGAVIFDLGSGAAVIGGGLHRICRRTGKHQDCGNDS
jgi:hypothetical protein